MPRGSPTSRVDLVPALTELTGAFGGESPRELQLGLVSVLVRIVVLERAAARGLLSVPASEWESWPRLIQALSRLGVRTGGLSDPARDEWLGNAEVSNTNLSRALALVRAFIDAWRSSRDETSDAELVGAAFEGFLDVELARDGKSFAIRESGARRRLGAHYTSRALTEALVRRTLAPLLAPSPDRDRVLALRICDPAMGGGAFLVEALRQLSEGSSLGREIATTCIYGVDRNPLAVDVARLALWLAVGDPSLDPHVFGAHLRSGDAIVASKSFEWRRAFPEVLQGPREGFDAMIGNPPWVSYAGRAAQPLSSRHRALYSKSPAFGGYTNLQALFVHRAATLLRSGGRLGFVLPTSMSDLDGYRISRKSHDELCDVDPSLPDFGDSFEGVFQPCMGLVSTKRATPQPASGMAWPLAREGIDGETRALLDRLDRMPRFSPASFGERGFQTNRGDVARLKELPGSKPPHTVALRTGSDVAAFARKSAVLYANPRDFGTRLRPPEQWRAVKLLIRQTARFPMVALSDGLAFRNSVLAGFADPLWNEHFLVAYLNAGPIRFYHYMRHRDARQGMPQLKIGHLRALPAPSAPSDATIALEALGRRLGERNEGATAIEKEELDRLCADALELSTAERQRVEAFVRSVKG